jgi:hypothetical protein
VHPVPSRRSTYRDSTNICLHEQHASSLRCARSMNGVLLTSLRGHQLVFFSRHRPQNTCCIASSLRNARVHVPSCTASQPRLNYDCRTVQVFQTTVLSNPEFHLHVSKLAPTYCYVRLIPVYASLNLQKQISALEPIRSRMPSTCDAVIVRLCVTPPSNSLLASATFRKREGRKTACRLHGYRDRPG